MPSSSNKPFDAAEWIKGLKAHAEAGKTPPLVGEAEKPAGIVSKLTSRAANAVDQKAPITKRVSQNWSKLAGEQKANVAMWGAGALLSAFGTVSAARTAFYRDDEGKIHTQWSNVGIALLQATLTVGCAYAGVHALQSATR